MQGRDLFEYAVIRLVPSVEREEFLNIGVILYCRQQRFLDVRFHLDPERIRAFSKEVELDMVEKYIRAFEGICKGTEADSPISGFESAERFRWLTAKRSSILQVSAVHPGLCFRAEETLEKLFQELVLC